VVRLFLIRHGRSVWNAEGRIQGCADPPLDQVERIAAREVDVYAAVEEILDAD